MKIDLAITTSPEGCAIEKFALASPAMKREIKVAVVLPPEYAARAEGRYPVLFCLHGGDAPYATYSEMPPLRRAICERPMIVVCFDGDRAGWYLDATKQAGSLFTTFMFDELIPALDQLYRTNGQRGVTGFSMGGFGAFHYLLTRPAAWTAVSSLSGAFSDEDLARPDWGVPTLLGPAAENQADYARISIFSRLADLLARNVRLPPIFFACGTEDDVGLIADHRAMTAFLAQQNEQLAARKAGWTVTFLSQESPGQHRWPYWRDMSGAIADFHWQTFQAAQAARETAEKAQTADGQKRGE